MIHRRRWPTCEAVELATLEWVDWFNHRRLLEPIGYIPPAEAEALDWQQPTRQALQAACLKPNSLHEMQGGSSRLKPSNDGPVEHCVGKAEDA